MTPTLSWANAPSPPVLLARKGDSAQRGLPNGGLEECLAPCAGIETGASGRKGTRRGRAPDSGRVRRGGAGFGPTASAVRRIRLDCVKCAPDLALLRNPPRSRPKSGARHGARACGMGTRRDRVRSRADCGAGPGAVDTQLRLIASNTVDLGQEGRSPTSVRQRAEGRLLGREGPRPRARSQNGTPPGVDRLEGPA